MVEVFICNEFIFFIFIRTMKSNELSDIDIKKILKNRDIDFSIKNKTRAEQTFVMFHELGHYYYKTESHCDLFASYHMLKQGFNPSQLYFSVNGCLSDNSIDRKNHVLNFAKKVKK